MKTYRKLQRKDRGILPAIAAIAGGTAIAGGIAGALGSRSSSTARNRSGIDLGPMSDLDRLLSGRRSRTQADIDAINQALDGLRRDDDLRERRGTEFFDFRDELEGVTAEDILSGRVVLSDELKNIAARDKGSAPRVGTIMDILQNTAEGGEAGVIEQEFQRIRDFEDSEDFQAARQAQQDLAAALEGAQLFGPLASQEDIEAAQGFASDIFAPRQVAFQQQLEDARTQSARQRALAGRSGADPILAAKLAQQAGRQQDLLQAEQGSFAAQFAQTLPGLRNQNLLQGLQLQSQATGVREGIANNSLQNRLRVLELGSQLQAGERNFRLQTGEQYSTTRQSNRSGGGLSGAITGGIAGAGAGLQMGSTLMGMPGFSTAQSFQPSNLTSMKTAAPQVAGPGTIGSGIRTPGPKNFPVSPANPYTSSNFNFSSPMNNFFQGMGF